MLLGRHRELSSCGCSISRTQSADLIGSLYERPRFRTMAELLIDLEEDLPGRAIVITELRIMNRQDG